MAIDYHPLRYIPDPPSPPRSDVKRARLSNHTLCFGVRGNCVGCPYLPMCSLLPPSRFERALTLPALLRARINAWRLVAGWPRSGRFVCHWVRAWLPFALSSTPAWPAAAGGRPSVPGCALAEAPPEGRAGGRGRVLGSSVAWEGGGRWTNVGGWPRVAESEQEFGSTTQASSSCAEQTRSRFKSCSR